MIKAPMKRNKDNIANSPRALPRILVGEMRLAGESGSGPETVAQLIGECARSVVNNAYMC